MGTYAAEWTAAIERTRRFGMSVPDHECGGKTRYLTDQRMQEFPYVVQRGLGDLDFHDVVAQCMAINCRLAPVLEEWIGCPVIYTLGWIDDGSERGMFRFDEAFIAKMLADGHKGGTVNLHAWLTLPSMEIIDVALATTIAVLQKRPEGHGAVLAKHPDELRGLAYKPMLVGTDFLRRSRLLVEWDVYEVPTRQV